MIPALKTVVKRVDIAAKKIFVVLPAGLKELYEGL
jgi:ribosomal 30S subunit maturation factor RimM